jgi:hypothetical protein
MLEDPAEDLVGELAGEHVEHDEFPLENKYRQVRRDHQDGIV